MKLRLMELGCPEKKVSVHYIGVPVPDIPFKQRRRPPKGKPIRVLQVSNLVEKKGTIYLLEAFSRIVKSHKNVELRLVGDGPMRPVIERRIRSLGLSDDVTLAGAKAHYEIPGELAAAHIFVHPSVTPGDGDIEATPIAIKEAMVSGLPVISTYHAGIPELIEHGRSGFLAPERDAGALALHLDYLLKHPEVWARFGECGRSTIEKHHDLRRQVEELELLYDKVLHGPS
jgi:colanic acid/amylovoran biosynthesis glycosyltransferase